MRRRWVAAGRVSCLLVLAGLLPPSGNALAGWRTFTTADGLTHNDVRGVLEARDETMWFATYGGGVSHYDGTRWRTYRAADGLASDKVNCIFEDRDGGIWAGTDDGGVTRISGDSLQTFRASSGLSSNQIFWITQDHLGRMWFATATAGAMRYDGTGWTRYQASPGGLLSNFVRCILEAHDHSMVFSTPSGVARLASGIWTQYLQGGGLVSNDVQQIFEDTAHRLWFATGGGVSRRDTLGNWITFTADSGLAGNNVRTVLQDRTGHMWFGSKNTGLSRYDGRSWRRFSDLDGYFTNSDAYSSFQDRSGNLWFGTSVGAARYDGVSMTTFADVPGLSTQDSFLPFQDDAGNIWVGTETAGYFIFGRDGTWTSLYVGQGGAQPTQDHAGNFWLPAFGGGVFLRDRAGHMRSYTTADGLANDYVRCALEDRNHDIWVCGNGGASRFHPADSTWTAYPPTPSGDGPVGSFLYDIFEDRDGSVWFGSAGKGVSRRDSLGLWKTFHNSDGLGDSTLIAQLGSPFIDFVLNMRQDPDGSYWFSTPGAGLNHFSGEPTPATVEHLTTANGLLNNSALSSLRTRDGDLWVALDNGGGAMRWDGSVWRTLGVEDGLPSGSLHIIFEDREGNLWFTSNHGVARYERDFVPPRTVIVAPPPNVSASRNPIATFGALGETDGATTPSFMEYSYRLDGGAWSAWSNPNTWSAQGLADGVHSLEVRARDYWTNVDSTAETATFEVDGTPPQPVLRSPVFGSPVRGTTAITGSATDPRFASYQVLVRTSGATSWDQASVIGGGASPVANGTLATWNTSTLADGDYELRLSVRDTLGLEGVAQVMVVVDNEAPFFDETTPVRVTAAGGGDIFTTNSEVHLYVPPHGFSEDAVVAVTKSPEVPSAPAGVVPIEPAYDVGWSGATLTKAATLEMSLAGADLSGTGGVAAIYRSGDGVSWTRMGGTVESGRVALAITAPGRYALFADGGGTASGAGLSRLTFTPRVFSPTGGFANTDVAIGFTLGRPGAVTVRVYNRAGRLVREVVAGRAMTAGANLVRWDGRDRDGDVVADGLYIVTVEALGDTQRSPLAVVR